jgi:hypothetical protein
LRERVPHKGERGKKKPQTTPTHTMELFQYKTIQYHTQSERKYQNGNAVHAMHHSQIQVAFATRLFAKGEIRKDFIEYHDEQT